MVNNRKPDHASRDLAPLSQIRAPLYYFIPSLPLTVEPSLVCDNETTNCSQICVRDVVNERDNCSCNRGFVLNEDGYTCDGKLGSEVWPLFCFCHRYFCCVLNYSCILLCYIAVLLCAGINVNIMQVLLCAMLQCCCVLLCYDYSYFYDVALCLCYVAEPTAPVPMCL